jgi:hypothetical protein
MICRLFLLINITLFISQIETFGSSIFGWVKDNQEDGIYGISVKLYEDQVHIRDTATDANGFYSFDCLLEGTYKIKFEAKDWTTNTVDGLNLSLGEEKLVNQILQVSESSGSADSDLFVRVIDGENLRPEPFVYVYVEGLASEDRWMKQTNKCGEVEWFLDSGEYSIKIINDEFKPVDLKITYQGDSRLIEIVLEKN